MNESTTLPEPGGKPETRRVFLLTWHKCGSQWTRDLLTHHLILHYSGFKNAGLTSTRSPECEWPDFPEGQIAGPIYNATYSDWMHYRRPGDRAIVIFRDPRDMIVSMIFSFAYSHLENKRVRQFREDFLLLALKDRIMAEIARFSYRLPSMSSWIPMGQGLNEDEAVYVSSYENFIADTGRELQSVVDFLGWKLPPGVVTETVRELSFERRSGRERGAEDSFSHYRKGMPGDWTNHFTFAAGFAFESAYPGLLAKLEYDHDPRWFRLLSNGDNGPNDSIESQRLRGLVEKEAELVRLREENILLRAELDRRSPSS